MKAELLNGKPFSLLRYEKMLRSLMFICEYTLFFHKSSALQYL